MVLFIRLTLYILQHNDQIIAYYDEFTVTNPLMSRAKKYKLGIIIVFNHFNPLCLFVCRGSLF